MAISVSCDREFLEITGDVVTRLTVPLPADPDTDATFTLAISDGARIDGTLADDGEYHFRIPQDGAGTMSRTDNGFIYHGDVERIAILTEVLVQGPIEVPPNSVLDWGNDEIPW